MVNGLGIEVCITPAPSVSRDEVRCCLVASEPWHAWNKGVGMCKQLPWQHGASSNILHAVIRRMPSGFWILIGSNWQV